MLKKIKKLRLSFNNLSAMLGSLIIVASILGAIYVGVWLMFIGGIIQIVNAIKTTPLVPIDIAIGVAKIVFCESSSLIAATGIILGTILIEKR